MQVSRILVSLMIAFILSAGSLCMPSRRVFIDIDCDKNISCAKNGTPICGTDNKTYDNACFMHKENQNRYCKVGNFNKVARVHDGKCR